jgi:hypothetical protein
MRNFRLRKKENGQSLLPNPATQIGIFILMLKAGIETSQFPKEIGAEGYRASRAKADRTRFIPLPAHIFVRRKVWV